MGIEADADYFNHSEYAQAWLAAREVYVSWYQALWSVWDACWQGLQDAGLTRLSTGEVEAEEWEVPSLATAWNQEWVGAIFRTRAKGLIGLYAYGDTKRVHLNYHAPQLKLDLSGWEEDDGDFDTVDVAYWKDGSLDLATFQEPVRDLVRAISQRYVSFEGSEKSEPWFELTTKGRKWIA